MQLGSACVLNTHVFKLEISSENASAFQSKETRAFFEEMLINTCQKR